MKYRKKPVVIEAFKWTGSPRQTEFPEWFNEAVKRGDILIGSLNAFFRVSVYIKTLEGEMTAKAGDYIIQGVAGEIYPCDPFIFEKTYEPVEEGAAQELPKRGDSNQRMLMKAARVSLRRELIDSKKAEENQ